jgi:hypothetical protein
MRIDRMILAGRRWAGVAAGMIAFSVCTQSLSACPNCRENLDQQAGDLPMGFALSIGLMLLAPMAILASWVVGLSWVLRRGREHDGLMPMADRATIGRSLC